MIRALAAMLCAVAAGRLLALAYRLAGPAAPQVTAPPKPPARIVPQRLPLRDLYDELACEALARLDRDALGTEPRTIEALGRAAVLLGMSRRGARLCDRRGAC